MQYFELLLVILLFNHHDATIPFCLSLVWHLTACSATKWQPYAHFQFQLIQEWTWPTDRLNFTHKVILRRQNLTATGKKCMEPVYSFPQPPWKLGTANLWWLHSGLHIFHILEGELTHVLQLKTNIVIKGHFDYSKKLKAKGYFF